MLNRIYIHPLTYIILLISFLASYFEYMYLLLLIIIVHELGHLMMIKLLGFSDSNITIYPFGGCTSYNSKVNENIFKEILICISGPFIQLLFMYLVYLLKDYIYLGTYNKFIFLNILLLKYNLLPIKPLDGGRLLNLLLDYVLPFKASLKITLYISYIACLIFLINSFFLGDLLFILIFILTFNNINKEYKTINNTQNKFLLERIIYDFNYKIIIIKSINKMKKNRLHIINNIYEKEYLKMNIFNV